MAWVDSWGSLVPLMNGIITACGDATGPPTQAASCSIWWPEPLRWSFGKGMALGPPKNVRKCLTLLNTYSYVGYVVINHNVLHIDRKIDR